MTLCDLGCIIFDDTVGFRLLFLMPLYDLNCLILGNIIVQKRLINLNKCIEFKLLKENWINLPT